MSRRCPAAVQYLALQYACGPGSAFAHIFIELAGGIDALWEMDAFTAAFLFGVPASKISWLDNAEYWMNEAEQGILAAQAAGDAVVCPADPQYPASLRHIDGPPLVLFLRGDADLFSFPAIGVVGTRRPTPGGRHIARYLGGLFADSGRVVVSGAASGIDGEAHRGAMQRGPKKTIAVLGTEMGIQYPREHRFLIEQVAESALVVSEYPRGFPVRPFHFAQRNRLIAGLSTDVVIIQAPVSSGALITANFALDQGKEVYACPWPEDMPSGAGCLALLADGAVPLVQGNEIPGIKPVLGGGSIADVLQAQYAGLDRNTLTPLEQRVLGMLSWEKQSLQDMVTHAGVSVQKLGAVLMMLEIKGFIRSWYGNAYTRMFL